MTDVTRSDDLTPDDPTGAEIDTLEEMAGAEQEYGEVIAEDLSTDDLVNDGADLLMGEPDQADRFRQDDGESHEETIDERLAQEQYDPASSIVPPPGGTDLDLADPTSGVTEDDVLGDDEDAFEDEVASPGDSPLDQAVGDEPFDPAAVEADAYAADPTDGRTTEA